MPFAHDEAYVQALEFKYFVHEMRFQAKCTLSDHVSTRSGKFRDIEELTGRLLAFDALVAAVEAAIASKLASYATAEPAVLLPRLVRMREVYGLSDSEGLIVEAMVAVSYSCKETLVGTFKQMMRSSGADGLTILRAICGVSPVTWQALTAGAETDAD